MIIPSLDYYNILTEEIDILVNLRNIERQRIFNLVQYSAIELRTQFIEYKWSRSTPEYVRIDNDIKKLYLAISSYSWVLHPDMMGR